MATAALIEKIVVESMNNAYYWTGNLQENLKLTLICYLLRRCLCTKSSNRNCALSQVRMMFEIESNFSIIIIFVSRHESHSTKTHSPHKSGRF